jgi:hypothetical protein
VSSTQDAGGLRSKGQDQYRARKFAESHYSIPSYIQTTWFITHILHHEGAISFAKRVITHQLALLLDLNSELAIKLLIQLNGDDTVLISPLVIATLLLLATLLTVRRALARLLGTKDLDSADTGVLGGVVEAAGDLEHAVLVRELDLGGGLLLNAVAVVEVEFSAGLAVTVGRDDEVEGLGADLGGGEGAFGAEGDDGTAANVQWDFGEVDVVESDLGALAFDDLPSVECVEAVVREVDGNAGAVLFSDRRDEDVSAVEELQSVAEDVGVVGVSEEEGVD